MKTKVYFTRDLSPEGILKMYKLFDGYLKGKIAVKLHSGEEGNQNYLRPDYLKDIIDYTKGTVVECNTAYDGERNTNEKHLKLLASHNWTTNFKVDLLDQEGPDLVLDIPNGRLLKENFVGKNLANYNSLLVLSHFKGHPMGGFGAALKQLSIGCASSQGKAWIHSAGKTKDVSILWDNVAPQLDFIESMAEAASSVHNYFKDKVLYINIMKNMSVDCDCCAVAEDPCLKDIGILISTDPIAIDKACLDLVVNSNDSGKEHFLERVYSRNGEKIIDFANKLGFASSDYELVEVD